MGTARLRARLLACTAHLVIQMHTVRTNQLLALGPCWHVPCLKGGAKVPRVEGAPRVRLQQLVSTPAGWE